MPLTRDFTPYDLRNGPSANPVSRAFAKSWGAEYVGHDRVVFRLWAPDLERLRVRIDGRNREMLPAGNGWFTLTVEGIGSGARYQFVMPDGRLMADPASRAQQGGAAGPSIVVDPTAYRWTVPAFKGHAWEDAVLYEIHIGTFTQKGTFAAAAAHFDELAALGVTMLQVMPVNQFSGERGWGYDGMLPYAPHHAYGSPEAMKAFVDAAHRSGISVMLGVVHGHISPEGGPPDAYLPSFFDSSRVTPFGFSQAAVRSFYIENAIYWLEEYNLDGLCLSAVDRLDGVSGDFLDELAERVRRETSGRRRHLVIADHRNATRHLGDGRYDACWNPDIRHAAHVIASGGIVGAVAPFSQTPVRTLATGLAEGFIHRGEVSPAGETRGERSSHLPPTAFVNFLQNHAKFGSGTAGERLIAFADPRLLKVMTAILALSPQIPMFFMGEDFGEVQPFRVFSDHPGGMPQGIGEPGPLADPNDPQAFEASKLRWARRDQADNRETRQRFRDLLAKRRAHVVPGLAAAAANAGRLLPSEDGVIAVDWHLAGRILQLRANLAEEARAVPAVFGTVIHGVPDYPAIDRDKRTGADFTLPGISMLMAVETSGVDI